MSHDKRVKVGDKVRRLSKSRWPEAFGEIGEVYKVLSVNGCGHIAVVDKNSYSGPDRFELVEEVVEKEWSEWEEHSLAREHSEYYKGCDWECCYSNVGTIRYRIKLPKHVKVSELKGTVQMKPDGTPDWSTYKE